MQRLQPSEVPCKQDRKFVQLQHFLFDQMLNLLPILAVKEFLLF